MIHFKDFLYNLIKLNYSNLRRNRNIRLSLQEKLGIFGLRLFHVKRRLLMKKIINKKRRKRVNKMTVTPVKTKTQSSHAYNNYKVAKTKALK